MPENVARARRAVNSNLVGCKKSQAPGTTLLRAAAGGDAKAAVGGVSNSRVATVNSPFELTVRLSSSQNPTVGKAPTVATPEIRTLPEAALRQRSRAGILDNLNPGFCHLRER